ncbi:hypothetical protein A2872_02115 [Candidatus Gottesmanbacteria bacterium RIFCSPHIGHO2_01_FULL_42_12]|uniref:Peptidase M16 n=1 Tax=Candidatus Gottesmanbacteria bacterium RIFCSPHIGHO2_01_FULL_42_12 TaxID=1798377 RepID=A0A1F5Z6E6_9BACT|nr:MAG: hypothetical protein A2872_02115 [Candidatus Gottesmanbacteria bacterium RIFCSPHIGHO2_01_FULL_42_12]
MFQKTVLDNGVRVVTVPMNSVQSAAALVMVKTGSRYEVKKTNGISHVLEHMALKRTNNYPNKFQIDTLLDSIGSSHNAFTSKEYTGFYVKAESRHLELILNILSGVVTDPLLDKDDLENEKKTIIEEINMYEDQPQAKVGELYEELLFAPNPLGWPIAGTRETVAALSREDIMGYIKNKYAAQNLVVGVAGNITALTSSQLNRYFEGIKIGEKSQFENLKVEQDRPKSLIFDKKTDQAHLCLGVRGYNIAHPDRYALSLLSIILGGNSSSRMFIEIREKRGLAYYVGSGAEEFADVGYFVTQAGLRIDSVPDAIKVMLGEFDKIKNEKISDEELRRAKDYWRGKMALSLEDSFRVASFYASSELLEDKIETPEEIMKKVDAVTTTDIQRVAKDIFVNGKLNLAVIGPFKDSARFDKILRL